jgi:hypothetical protein
MRKQVEAWMTKVAAKEALCARYHLIADDVRPILGAMGAWAWGQYVVTKDLSAACRELEYRIEAGSTQRPNKNYQVQQTNSAVQVMGPILQAYAQQTGDLGPMNALLADWAKARDLDPNRYQMRAAPMPMPTNPAEANPVTGGQQTTSNSEIPS